MPRRKKPTAQTPLSLSKLRTPELVKQTAARAQEPVNYYVKVLVFGRAKGFCYTVTKQDWERVSNIFNENGRPFLLRFVTFDDIENGAVVHVNPDFVLLHQALFDAGRNEPTPAPDSNRVTIYMHGMEKPLEFEDMDGADIDQLTAALELMGHDSAEFISFVDCDGEENSIRVDRIMIVEVLKCPDED